MVKITVKVTSLKTNRAVFFIQVNPTITVKTLRNMIAKIMEEENDDVTLMRRKVDITKHNLDTKLSKLSPSLALMGTSIAEEVTGGGGGGIEIPTLVVTAVTEKNLKTLKKNL